MRLYGRHKPYPNQLQNTFAFRNTLSAYLHHLKVILENCKDNQVTPEKLAISIGPSLW